MKKEETGYLVHNKLGEGKSYSKINEELQDLKRSQIIFKHQERDIKRSSKEVEKLKRENNKLRQQNLNLGMQKLSEDKIEYKGDLRYLNRVMTVLSNALVPITERNVAEQSCTSTKYIKPCVKFLARWSLIEATIKKRSVIYYSIKSE